RRFNLRFALFDEERCEAITEVDTTCNPFEDEQCVIASVGWLAHSRKRAQQLLEAGWDLLVVDEAHHLAWAPEAPSREYSLVESLAQATAGVILLTATPEQLGRSGHFARLRLLDPARYADLDAFMAESDRHLALSQVTEALLEA
ncbi:DEAD/DEAH box helicase family protein, partial [Vogesella mureinivorans]|uniref:DEAD/DEAH box helicase family protein n=1 Tax=Vogesella mureinivorans TaxID=657276 RepID=UPI00197D418A